MASAAVVPLAMRPNRKPALRPSARLSIPGIRFNDDFGVSVKILRHDSVL